MNRPSVACQDLRKSLIRNKSLFEQIQAADSLRQEGCPPNKDILCDFLNACTALKDLSAGKYLHSILKKMGVHTMSYMGDHLIRMYVSCGRLQDTLDVFHQVSHPSIYTWNAIISAHSQLNQHCTALALFSCMLHRGIVPDKFTFLCTLKATCKLGDYPHCRYIHDLIIRIGLDRELVVMNTVIDTYAKCGALPDAHKVFFLMEVKNVVSWGALIAGYATQGDGFYALDLFREMQEGGDEPHFRLFGSLLKACSGVRAIVQGWWVHDKILRSGFECDAVIGSALIDMYAKCGDVFSARMLFNRLRGRDVIAWAALISGYTAIDMPINALQAYVEMRQEGIMPDSHIFSSVIKASSGIRAVCHGMWVHDQIIRHEFGLNVVIGCGLVNFYGTCGLLGAALNVFDRLPERNILSWGALIACFVQGGHEPFALVLFGKLCKEGLTPDEAILACILHVCGSVGATDAGYLVHTHIVTNGIELNNNITKNLLEMYIESGNMKDAQGTFSILHSKDEEAWGLIMKGYCQYEDFSHALDTFVDMQQSGVLTLDRLVCSCVLKASGRTKNMDKGRGIHDQIIKNGWESDAIVGSALVDMYGNCGRVEEARLVFDSIAAPDVVAWGSMMAACEQHGDAMSLLQIYEHMQGGGVEPDKAILGCLVKACGHAQAIQQGHMIHDLVVRAGLESDTLMQNILLDMYANCECLKEAQRVFDKQQIHDAVSWSTMIAAYMQNGHNLASLDLFESMQHEDLEVDAVLLTCVANACGFVGLWKSGMFIHDLLVKKGWESKEFVVRALTGMYGKCGIIEGACRVFDMVEEPDENLYGELIAAFVMQGHGEHALLLYECMKKSSLLPNEVTTMWLLKACGEETHIEQGLSLHCYSIKCGIEDKLPIANSLVQMYAKCSRMQESSQAFMKMPTRDNSTWSTRISASLTNGGGYAGLLRHCIDEMQVDGLHPDGANYTSLLQAYTQAGLIEDCLSCFNSSIIAPNIEHYSCMIDLFGRLGWLNVAEDVMQTMPIQHEVLTWTSFFNSCRTYGNVKVGNHCVDNRLNRSPFRTFSSCGSQDILQNLEVNFQRQGMFFLVLIEG